MLEAESVWIAAHWHLEICNALWMAERRKRLNAAGVAQAAALLAQLPVSIDPETSVQASSRTLELARKHAISVYDAAYLELALRRGATLASLDGPLRDIAGTLGVQVAPAEID
jgi:predicted nucleic acid-binding protein